MTEQKHLFEACVRKADGDEKRTVGESAEL